MVKRIIGRAQRSPKVPQGNGVNTMAKAQYFLIIDTETTIANNVADFGSNRSETRG